MDNMNLPFATYCAKCQTLMHTGAPVSKTAPGTYQHIVCPNTNMRHFAAHKHPDTGMDISPR